MIEVLKQALEALEFFNETAICSADTDISNEAITSLRQAIAELESQEPVAEARFDGTLHWLEPYGIGLHRVQGQLYTHPPQRKCENCGEFGTCCLKTESQEPVAWNRGVPPIRPQQKEGETFIVSYEDTRPPQRTKVVFPTMLRKMWSGSEVQAWLDENVNKGDA